MTEKNGILAVSFGTSFPDTRKKTLDQVEADLRKQNPQWKIFRAWTSGRIRRKIARRDNLVIPDVRGALEQMRREGITRAVIQPTHVLNGIENEQMLSEIREFRDQFEFFGVGDPLLTSQEDCERVVRVIAEEIPLDSDEVLVLMGHGTSHYSNFVYAALDYLFRDQGYSRMLMGTVEAYPSFETVLKQVRILAPGRVVLSPFMMVAGDHAVNDLAGEDDDSWKSRFEKEGFPVRCVLKGLGEYQGIRDIILDHAQAAMKHLDQGSGGEEE
ncbi:MAG: sirohydrochlorin cobaltochelatase [Candidatus Choladocola sp.]|nr:sirohydrochlorin cobaltochelatase [Candidatus Choladocola sp.]